VGSKIVAKLVTSFSVLFRDFTTAYDSGEKYCTTFWYTNEINHVNLNLKMRVFWDIAPCSLVGVDRRFRGVYCLYYLMMEALHTLEMSVFSNKTAISQKTFIFIFDAVRT
jgi:hypothetical protein